MSKTPEQLIEIATRHQVYLEGLKTSEYNKLSGFITELDKEVTNRIATKNLTEYTRKRMDSLLTGIRMDAAALANEFNEELTASALALADYEAGFEQRALESVTVNYSFDLPTAGQIKTAVLTNPLQVQGASGGLILEGFLSNFSQSVQDKLSSTIRLGWAQGLTTNQILQAVRGTRALKYKDGVIQVINRDAEAVVRTALQSASTQARLATWEANSDIIRGYEWISTLDSRTTTICRTLSGKVFQIGKGPLPPIHYQCRSTTAPALDERFAILEDNATQMARGADGKVDRVSADLNYYQWLKRQPANFQDSVIGPTRGQLLRNGGLSADRFAELQLNSSFKPLTLAEMRELEPLAFERIRM